MNRYLFLFISLLIGFSSCEVNTLSNGVLDGYWHLITLDSINGAPAVDMIPEKIYWSVQARMLETRSSTGLIPAVSYRFIHKDDSLLMCEPTFPSWFAITASKNDESVTDVAIVQPYGINNLQESFHILRLDDDEMILESQLLRLYFERY